MKNCKACFHLCRAAMFNVTMFIVTIWYLLFKVYCAITNLFTYNSVSFEFVFFTQILVSQKIMIFHIEFSLLCWIRGFCVLIFSGEHCLTVSYCGKDLHPFRVVLLTRLSAFYLFYIFHFSSFLESKRMQTYKQKKTSLLHTL